jgi:hypothetical protein
MVNVFSFCLYGPETPKYYTGLLENIQLINRYYPEWKIYVYAGDDVTDGFLATLRANPSVVLIQTGVHGHLNSVHRFFAIDEPGVDIAFFRDADSRIHWKDRWAINDFLASGRAVHITRDHKEHGSHIPAGLWGVRKGVFATSLRQSFQDWKPIHAGNGRPDDPSGFGIDQNFLGRVIYPGIRAFAFVHYSNGQLFREEVGKEFPFMWSDSTYCGKVEIPGTPDLPQPAAHSRIPALNFLPRK